MTKGYLVMAQGEKCAHQAEALAHSISKTQSCISRLSVITDQEVNSTLFDKIIRMPVDFASNSEWKIENRVQFYDLTPYDETVILDSDMLFLSDVSHWWSYLKNYDLFLTNKVTTYRGDRVSENNPYRKAFIFNNLPNVYSAFAYFKKTQLTSDFFTLVKQIILNWNMWTPQYTSNYVQKFPSIDLAMAIAVDIMDIEHEVTSNHSFPTFTHMKGRIQGWKNSAEDWDRYIGIYSSDGEIKLGPCEQTGILHYVKKDFL
jgi:hypothetical protein